MYSAATKEFVRKFVGIYGDRIVAALTDSDLFFPSSVAQMMVESRWGQDNKGKDASTLALLHNNWAGIKDSTNPKSGQIPLSTTEGPTGHQYTITANFATYPDFETFLQDYVRILHLPNYVKAGVFDAETPEDQILAIGRGGYSTNLPSEYLRVCRGRIEACRDLFKWGKISTSVTEPTVVPSTGNVTTGAGGYAASIKSGILSSIQSVLSPFTGQNLPGAGGNKTYSIFDNVKPND